MSEYPSMYDAAIEYAKKGFAVFPLKYRDKVPLTRNGCKDATTDAAQIKAWWQKYPNANIGLATGSVSQNVFVIDLDIDEDRGSKRLMKIMDFQKMKIKDWVNFARILRCGTRYCCCSAQRRYIRTLLTNYTAVS